MSHPYQFSEPDKLTSPLYVLYSASVNETTANISSDQKPAAAISSSLDPSSFKTDVNRNKTRKWIEAKPPQYGGDDWGDYDPLDEYGVEEAPPLPGPTNVLQRKPS